ncbi:MAG: hypothetical protein LC676_10785 [Loktanella sp.]|nr:hypothetical protein [Loktanella sp.]
MTKTTPDFQVWGLNDLGDIYLADADTAGEARAWIARYVRHGDWGGHEGLAILTAQGDHVETYWPREDAA